MGVKFIFCLQINTKVFYKFIVLILVNVPRHVQSTQNNKLQYLKENVMYEVYFLPADKRLGLFKRILSFQVWVAKHGQITQNNNCAIPLQQVRKEVSDEFCFLHESLLQIDKMILMGMIKHPQSCQNNKFAKSL